MLHTGPRASESKILPLPRGVADRGERPSDDALKSRKRWPFTVAAAYGSVPLDSVGHQDSSTFVT